VIRLRRDIQAVKNTRQLVRLIRADLAAIAVLEQALQPFVGKPRDRRG